MNIFFSKSFKVGIFIGILAYIIVYAYNMPLVSTSKSICFDYYETSGFPFISHESGTILHLDKTLWLGLTANILIAVLVILGVGLLFNFIPSEISSRRLDLK